MAILISKTFERFESHDDDDNGCEPDESGFVFEDQPYTFREVVDMLRGGEPSSMPTFGDVSDWVTYYETNEGTRDYYESGSRENESIHYSRANPERNVKWWYLAFKVAGLIKINR